MERTACAPERPADEDKKEHRPDPARKTKDAVAWREEQDRQPDACRCDARCERPSLRLIGEAARCKCEQRESRPERKQRTPGDLGFLSACEDNDREQKPEDEPESDRAEDDEGDATSLARRGAGGLSWSG